MNDNSRLFDFLLEQVQHDAAHKMLWAKQGNTWNNYTAADVLTQVNKLSAALLKKGLHGYNRQVEEKDKVAVISNNRPEWLMLDLACQQIGVVLCPIYPTTNQGEISFIFNDAAVKMVFTGGTDTFAKATAVAPLVPGLQEIISFDDIPGALTLNTLLTDVKDAEVTEMVQQRDQIKAQECATIIYTSGTTGFPKGVMLSHRNIVSNVLNSVKSFPFEDGKGKRALSFLPLNHIFERMVSYIYLCTGTAIYYAQSLETIGDDLKEVQPHCFTTVPRLLEKVYEKIMNKGNELNGIAKKLFNWAVDLGKEYDVQKPGSITYRLQLSVANKIIFKKWREALGNQIEFIITGGAACQVRLIRIFSAAGIPIYEGYGPTENSPVISVNRKSKGGTRFGSVGPVIEGQEVKLQPDGEICVKGPSVMLGYYKRPDLTNEVVIDGWLHTGDIGVFEQNKFLKITDRKKELFKTSGGKYVAPQVIENKMKESPFIEQIMVVGSEQKFVGALIVPSEQYLKEWMAEKQLPFTSMHDALHQKPVQDLFKEIVEDFNAGFNHVEQVKKFELLEHEWSIDSGEMTPKLSLKRKVIMEKYAKSIARIYH